MGSRRERAKGVQKAVGKERKYGPGDTGKSLPGDVSLLSRAWEASI